MFGEWIILLVFQRSHMQALQSDSNIIWVHHRAWDTSKSNCMVWVFFWKCVIFLSRLQMTALLHVHQLDGLLSTCATSAGDSPLLELCTWILHTSDRVPSQPLLGFSLQHKDWWAKGSRHQIISGPPVTANASACAQQKLNQVSPESSPFCLKLKPSHSVSTRKSQTFLVVCLLKAAAWRATLQKSMRTRTHLRWASPEGPQI